MTTRLKIVNYTTFLKFTEIEECNLPNDIKPKLGELNTFPSQLETESVNTQDLCWLTAAAFGLKSNMEPQIDSDTDEKQQLKGPPTWSAMNSVLNEPLPVARIATPPLIAAPAHGYSTIMTVLKQAQKINTILVGETHKTVVSLDMGLYKPAQKLLMEKRNEIKNIVLRPGELHIVIAMLRTIGCFIDNSGIDVAWLHADQYSQSTINQPSNRYSMVIMLKGGGGQSTYCNTSVAVCHELGRIFQAKPRSCW